MIIQLLNPLVGTFNDNEMQRGIYPVNEKSIFRFLNAPSELPLMSWQLPIGSEAFQSEGGGPVLL